MTLDPESVRVLGGPCALGACNRAPTTQTLKAPSSPPPGFVLEPTPSVDSRIDALESRLDVLDDRVNGILNASATLDTESENYGIARTQFGAFTVKSLGVTPYLDGYKVRIAIGNLTTATFHGVKLKAEWSLPLDVNRRETWDAYRKSRKSRVFDLTTILRPGSYNVAEITLTPAKAEEAKSIEIGLELNLMALR